jgi:hypothetical protein
MKTDTLFFHLLTGQSLTEEETQALLAWLDERPSVQKLGLTPEEREDHKQVLITQMLEDRVGFLIRAVRRGTSSLYYEECRSPEPGENIAVCYGAQIGDQQHEDMERGKPFREYEALESLLTGKLPEVVPETEEPNLVSSEVETKPLPRNDFLREDCEWPFQLLFLVLQEVREGRLDPERAFLGVMLALAGEHQVKVPSESALLEARIVDLPPLKIDPGNKRKPGRKESRWAGYGSLRIQRSGGSNPSGRVIN